MKHGLAEWVEFGASIRFVRDQRDHREQSTHQNAIVKPYWYDRAAHAGVASATALANTPVVAPGILLGLGKRKGASRHTFLATRGF